LKKIIKTSKTQDFAGIAVALALIVLSAVMMGISFGQFNNASVEAQDQQLKTIESSLDYNIDETIDRFDRQMDYVVSSKSFKQALEAETDEETGGERITDILRNSSLSNMTPFEALIIMKGNKVFATSAEGEDYVIGDKIEGNTYACKDEAGDEYLAIEHDALAGMKCYGIMDITAIYRSILPRANAESESVILLFNAGDTLIYESGDEVKTCSASEISGREKIDAKEAEFLSKSQESGETIAEGYEKELGNEGAATRALAVPAGETENKAFGIAVTADYSTMTALMKRTITKILLFFLMAIAGIVMLVIFLIKTRRERSEIDLELEKLKEKNQQMEELNEKLRELEHHQRLETIGTMTSGIAHEFNNLLAPIMGYSIMTLEKLDPNDEVLYDGVLEIYNASKKAKDIISRLSDLARKNTEKVFTRIEPDAMINRAISVTAPSLPKNVDLMRDFNCKGRYINGNETQLSQLLINLIINAFQALSAEGGTVTVGTEAKDGEVIITISDDGPGIPDNIKESIFEPFFTTKEAGAGTGLGLAIVRQAAEDHGGRITLDSEEGKGSCFKVYIPEDTTPVED